MSKKEKKDLPNKNIKKDKQVPKSSPKTWIGEKSADHEKLKRVAEIPPKIKPKKD